MGFPIGRAILCLVGAGALVLGASVQRARAELRDQLDALGPSLDGLAGEHDGAGTLVVNGVVIVVRSASVTGDVAAALAPAHARCGGDADAPFGAALGAWDGDGGFVACFPAMRGLDPEQTIDAARAVIGRGDARGLGAFVYTYAHRTARGAHVVEATLPALDLGAMFPAGSDAPGADVPGVPRPANARRILSAEVPGDSYRIAVYAVDGEPRAIAAAVEDDLVTAGWELRPVRDRGDAHLVYAFRDASLVAIVVRPDRGGATVTVAREL
jgi:hypothetical protein